MNSKLTDKIIEILVPRLQPAYLIVFGSYAKGCQREDSDIDIAFYCEDESPSRYETFLLAQELASLLKIEVDLVDLKQASTVFQAQIYSTGTVIYCENESLRMKEQMKALRMYAKLNEERKSILEGIDKRGTIYEK